MATMRRLIGCAAIGLLAVPGAVPGAMPAWGDDPDGAAASAAAFDRFEIEAQSQAAAGYLFAVGDEENRLAGARIGVAKPADVYALAAAFQRGLAAGYFYAAVLGRSAAGGAGVAPEPPPGESRGLYPSEPRASTWEGPVTAGANGPVVDGRSEARASAEPTGDATLQLHGLAVPGQLAVEDGRISSRGGPVAAGIEGASESVLSGVTIGAALRIETLTSRAVGLIPVDGAAPVTSASTVVEGATVGGTPVRITHAGLELGDQTPAGAPKAQLLDQVRQALAAANIEDVRLAEATITEQPDGVKVTAGALRVIYRNASFGAQNPQGFSGGGFELGGATVSVTAHRSPPEPSSPAGSDSLAEAGPPADAPASDASAAPAPSLSGTPAGAQAPAGSAAGASAARAGADRAVAGSSAGSAAGSAAGRPAGSGTGTALAVGALTDGVPARPAPGGAALDGSGSPSSARPSGSTAALPDDRATLLTAVAAASRPPDPGREAARWSGAAFLLLGSIPLWVVLAFGLARPTTRPASSRKGS